MATISEIRLATDPLATLEKHIQQSEDNGGNLEKVVAGKQDGKDFNFLSFVVPAGPSPRLPKVTLVVIADPVETTQQMDAVRAKMATQGKALLFLAPIFDAGAQKMVAVCRDLPVAAAQPAGGVVGNASSGYVNQLAALARKQFTDFHEFDESDPPLRDQIGKYWEEIGFNFPGIGTAWSAVFISWCMRTAGASPADFKVSTAHSRFVFWAIQNQLGNRGLFRGHPLGDYRPVVGDIIQNNRGGQALTYAFARAHEAYESHSAIVVEAGSDGEGRFVRTVGGNENNSVGRKRVALTSDGFVRQRDSNPYICVIQNLK